jgi:hypothetical protein
MLLPDAIHADKHQHMLVAQIVLGSIIVFLLQMPCTFRIHHTPWRVMWWKQLATVGEGMFTHAPCKSSRRGSRAIVIQQDGRVIIAEHV